MSKNRERKNELILDIEGKKGCMPFYAVYVNLCFQLYSM